MKVYKQEHERAWIIADEIYSEVYWYWFCSLEEDGLEWRAEGMHVTGDAIPFEANASSYPIGFARHFPDYENVWWFFELEKTRMFSRVL